MKLKDLDRTQIISFMKEGATKQHFCPECDACIEPITQPEMVHAGLELECPGCGKKDNMAVLLTLRDYRETCFNCEHEFLDRELEGWC